MRYSCTNWDCWKLVNSLVNTSHGLQVKDYNIKSSYTVTAFDNTSLGNFMYGGKFSLQGWRGEIWPNVKFVVNLNRIHRLLLKSECVLTLTTKALYGHLPKLFVS